MKIASFTLVVGLAGSLGLAILLVKKIEIVIFSKTQARAHPKQGAHIHTGSGCSRLAAILHLPLLSIALMSWGGRGELGI